MKRKIKQTSQVTYTSIINRHFMKTSASAVVYMDDTGFKGSTLKSGAQVSLGNTETGYQPVNIGNSSDRAKDMREKKDWWTASQKQPGRPFVFTSGHGHQSLKSAHSGIPGRVERIGSGLLFAAVIVIRLRCTLQFSISGSGRYYRMICG